jgi:hypothetical protein
MTVKRFAWFIVRPTTSAPGAPPGAVAAVGGDVAAERVVGLSLTSRTCR